MKARLGDVCTVVSGSTPKSTVPEYWDGDIKWITPAELSNDTCIINDSARHITALGVAKTGLKPFPAGTVILSSRAPIGKTAIAGCEMFCNQGFKNLICSEKIDSKYLYYFLSGKTDYLNSLGRGATFKEISKAIVENIEIPLPEVEEQKRIAARFERLLRLIQLQKAELEELDKLVKSRFIELFGEADGFESVPLNDSVDEMFKGPFGSSLKNECFVVAEQGYCMVYEQKHAIKKTMDVDTRFVDEKKYKELRRFTVQGGDIIVSCRGTIGETFIVPEDAPLGIMHPSIMKIRLKTAIYNRVFFNHLLQTVLNRHEADANGSGVKMAITATALGKERFIRPPMALQEQFAAFVEQTDKSKYYSSLSFRYCQAAANTYRQEWMTCRTSDF